MKKNIYFYETNTPIGKIGIATTENDSHITDLTWESDFENLKKENDFQICETELIKQAKNVLIKILQSQLTIQKLFVQLEWQIIEIKLLFLFHVIV